MIPEVFMNQIVLIKGAGDLATGIACRLFRCGFTIIMTELAQPTVVRRTVAFAEAIYTGWTKVEEIIAVKADVAAIEATWSAGCIPIIVDPPAQLPALLHCHAVVDAIIAKRNTGTAITDAPLVIGVGPGFVAGQDVHRVVETKRGHDLGRVWTTGSALPNTGIPGEIGGFTSERLLRAPIDGTFYGIRAIGELVACNDIVAEISGNPVKAAINGVLRGLLHDGLAVTAGMKIGDIDPRCRIQHCFTISDKARAIGGGVLEALLMKTCS
jgi:xanthine dehydrogenase accessory factor